MNVLSGNDSRLKIRTSEFTNPTPGIAPGYTQANLVILPKKYALDFFIFCQRNPKPCPILDVLEPGNFVPVITAKNADIRTDIPKYNIYENGVLTSQVNDITNLWQDDFVTFLLGCSFTFEKALLDENIHIRHIEENKNVPMYITNIECVPSKVFSGPMVVSMRPIKKYLVEKAIEVTSKYPRVHGAPVHVGNPKLIGINDINNPDFGDSVTINEDEVPVFWACGVTPQASIMKVKPDFVITHAPGHMFICDIKDDELSDF